MFRYKYPELVFRILLFKNPNEINSIFPLGLSFIIFHCISYIVDLYKLDKQEKYLSKTNMINYMSYILFFPKLIQGPIVRYTDMKNQLVYRDISYENFYYALNRFIIGFCKKTIVADTLGGFARNIFSLNKLDTPTAWMGVLIFTMQIYVDFSAYSDMAIALARFFGFKIPENFQYPYVSKSISEFWNRWHISLGNWFKNYVYFPLGGNRRGNVYLNILVVFLLTGIWHGNTSIYLLWGLIHGLFVMLEKTKVYKKISQKKGFSVFGWIYTMFVVSIGWLCFILPDTNALYDYIKVLFGITHYSDIQLGWQLFYTPRILFYVILGIAISVIPASDKYKTFVSKLKKKESYVLISNIVLLFLFSLGYVFMISNGYSPFIYFKY
ncbi:MAG: MBOAT family O-acyltransferase [Clostridia bacterium]|nr:MBOAT family O-acyltransferase [Clostridia bacterium]